MGMRDAEGLTDKKRQHDINDSLVRALTNLIHINN